MFSLAGFCSDSKYRIRKRVCDLAGDSSCQNWVGREDEGGGSEPGALAVVSYHPAAGSTQIPQDTDLSITFNQPVAKGTGSIEIRLDSDGSVFWSVDVSDVDVIVSGSSVRIVTGITLTGNTAYYVTYPSGAFETSEGESLPALTDTSTWTFTTRGGVYAAVSDLDSFVAGGKTYVVEGISSDGGADYNTISNVYELDTTTDSLIPVSTFPTYYASDIAVFEYGGTQYVLVANRCYGSCSAYNGSVSSPLYRFDPTSESLILVQNITTEFAMAWTSHNFNGTVYAIVGNRFSGYTNLGAFVYRFNGASLEKIQTITSPGPYDWKLFEAKGNLYALEAYSNYTSTYTQASKFLKFNGSTFSQIQGITTTGAKDWETFEVDGETYALIANLMVSSTNYNATSRFYHLDSATEQMVPLQDIPTYSALDWEVFVDGGETYAILAHGGGSTIYKFNPVTQQMDEYRTLAIAASTWRALYADGKTYLLKGGSYGTSLYRFDQI